MVVTFDNPQDLHFKPKLNAQQLDMIQLLATPLPESDYLELKSKVVELLSKKLDMVVEKWEEANEITPSHYLDALKGHFRVHS